MNAKYLCLLGLLISSASSAIINGEPCSEEEFPASLELVIRESDETYVTTCGATLIAADVAVTAAHCVKDIKTEYQLYVSSKADFGYIYDREFDSDSARTIQVKTIITHGAYSSVNGDGPRDDIALLFLFRKFEITPAHMLSPFESESLATGLKAYIIGWGQQKIGLKDEVHTLPTKHCATSFVNKIKLSEIQLGSGKHSPHKCFGDSGGATYVQLSTGMRFTGVTSHGKHDDTTCKKGGYDTRVDFYYDWIIQQMQEGCTKGYRLFCR
ncbi:MAG: trypsin-like serine protease [Myxococcaceae bacterium]